MAGELFFAAVKALAFITNGLEVGTTMKVNGTSGASGNPFTFNIYNDNEKYLGGDIQFHISIRPNDEVIVRNTFTNNNWGPEERDGSFKTYPKNPFTIEVVTGADAYQIKINGQTIPSYKYRDTLSKGRILTIAGDATVDFVKINDKNVM